MPIVERYILRRAFVIFAAATLATLAIAWTTQVLARINLVTDSGQSATAFMELATLILPRVIPEVLPFAVAIGVAQALSTMNTDSELVVINAAGASRMTIAKPVLILALGAAVLSFLIQNTLDPYTRQRARELISSARADLISSLVQEGSFRKIDENLYLQIGERLPDGRLGSVFVSDSRQDNLDLTYYAKSATVVDKGPAGNILVMEDGEVHRKEPEQDVSIVRFSSYAFDLSEFTGSATGKVTLHPKDQHLSFLLNPDPNDRFYKANPLLFEAEIHKRMSTWLLPLAFALIALGVAGDARSHREARVHPLLSTIFYATLVRWGGYFSFGKASLVPMMGYALYLIPIGAGVIALAFYMTGRTMEMPTAFNERIALFGARIRDALSMRLARLFRGRASRDGAAP